MARALSQVYTIIRGSVGGITYLANQFHQIVVRARTAPVNPSTAQQTLIRSAFSSASENWKQASDADRQRWEVYAPSASFSGPLGSYTIPGRSIMMAGFSLATYLNDAGFLINTPVVTPPTETGFATLASIFTTAPAVPSTGFDLGLTNFLLEDIGALVNVSLGFHPSRNFYKGPWDLSLTLGATVPGPGSVLVPISGLVEGLKYFFRVKGVIIDGPHRITAEFFGSAIAETTVI